MSTPSLPRTRAALTDAGIPIEVVERTGSTNADLLDRATALPDGAVVATMDQTAGRGRLDRSWSAPPGETLAVSMLVRSPLADRDRGWLPLVAGAAMRDAVATVLLGAPDGGDPTPTGADAPGPDRASRPTVQVKWPNDVLVDERKVCGILCQVAPDGAVVVGAGVNLTIPADRLPTATATSLAIAGAVDPAEDLADAVLSAWWRAVREAVADLVAGGAAAETVRSHVRSVCGTIGRRVRLELPDGSVEEADAVGIDDDGRITIRDRRGHTAGVAVGDLTHLRYA